MSMLIAPAFQGEDLSCYANLFLRKPWSDEERRYLSPFATNIDGTVSVLHGLPPEMIGAICSRTSRTEGSLLRVLLDEYIFKIIRGEDRALAKELEDVIDFLNKHGFKNILNNQRAQEFYAKCLAQFGDESIAQLTGTHVFFEGISQVLMKFIQDMRIGIEPIEKSTRFIFFAMKILGRYQYCVPEPDLLRHGMLNEYRRAGDNLFDTYGKLFKPLVEFFVSAYPDEKRMPLEKKALDVLRGLLPMATLGQVAFRGNAQAWEYLITRLAQQELGEFRWAAQALYSELNKEIPSLLLRLSEEKALKYQRYIAQRQVHVSDEWSWSLFSRGNKSIEVEVDARPRVKLVTHNPAQEAEVITAMVFSSRRNHQSWQSIYRNVQKMPQGERRKLVEAYLRGRTQQWEKVGRAFENANVRFEITMDIGAYRDLHRHRMLTQDRQEFSTHHGYVVPDCISEAGLEIDYRRAMDWAREVYEKLERKDPLLAQYIVPLGYNVRFYQYTNWRELFWEIELRTGPQGHPNYRWIEQEKFRLLRRKYPLFTSFMKVDMKDYAVARRGIEEKSKAKEQRVLEKLQGS